MRSKVVQSLVTEIWHRVFPSVIKGTGFKSSLSCIKTHPVLQESNQTIVISSRDCQNWCRLGRRLAQPETLVRTQQWQPNNGRVRGGVAWHTQESWRLLPSTKQLRQLKWENVLILPTSDKLGTKKFVTARMYCVKDSKDLLIILRCRVQRKFSWNKICGQLSKSWKTWLSSKPTVI